MTVMTRYKAEEVKVAYERTLDISYRRKETKLDSGQKWLDNPLPQLFT